MRVYFKEGKGYLTCKGKRGDGDAITVPFDPKTLMDWYPLTANYEYRYDHGKRQFFLAPTDDNHPRRYGIKKRRRLVASPEASFTAPDFYVPEVREDNRQVLRDVIELGLDIEVGTKKDIEEVHKDLSYKIDFKIKEAITDRAFEEMDIEEWENYYRTTDEEARDRILYAYLTEEEEEKLYKSGNIRVLLNLIRKQVS